jgi:hypothetical protein
MKIAAIGLQLAFSPYSRQVGNLHSVWLYLDSVVLSGSNTQRISVSLRA